MPFESIVIPLHTLMRGLCWTDTYAALILPEVAGGLVIIHFRQFFAGILSCGLARASCAACGRDFLAAVSCQGRAVCTSWNSRRMVETAAHLVDHVLPSLPLLPARAGRCSRDGRPGTRRRLLARRHGAHRGCRPRRAGTAAAQLRPPAVRPRSLASTRCRTSGLQRRQFAPGRTPRLGVDPARADRQDFRPRTVRPSSGSLAES